MVARRQPDKSDMNRTQADSPNAGNGLGQRGLYIIAPVSDPIPPNGSGVLKIPLDAEASAMLREIGDAFLVIGSGAYPEHPGKMVLHVVSLPKSQVDGACRVAMGEARAVKIKEPE